MSTSPAEDSPQPRDPQDSFGSSDMPAANGSPADEETVLRRLRGGDPRGDTPPSRPAPLGGHLPRWTEQRNLSRPADPTIPFDPKLDRPKRKPSRLDLEADPLLRLEDNRRSVKHAIMYAAMIPIITLVTGAVIALLSRSHGGPICDSGYSTWICTRTDELLFPILPGLISFGGMLGAGAITWRQWAQDRYWQPWLGIVWLLIPFCLLWVTGVGAMAIVGQH
ncbi:hypothetical protein ACFPVT_02890 [Corynebacterium choanae]|uniref:Uncharacterized protein n=1 Tax=Corynebacterium choanae TaxID=1862358 RepID=A0A3G6J6C9_9CORY|nr:hypothetical protein [Corynebacterium choanae]AZA12478.1 hypothetical protein CCHOA_00230 [Corynebacterium choanae]